MHSRAIAPLALSLLAACSSPELPKLDPGPDEARYFTSIRVVTSTFPDRETRLETVEILRVRTVDANGKVTDVVEEVRGLPGSELPAGMLPQGLSLPSTPVSEGDAWSERVQRPVAGFGPLDVLIKYEHKGMSEFAGAPCHGIKASWTTQGGQVKVAWPSGALFCVSPEGKPLLETVSAELRPTNTEGETSTTIRFSLSDRRLDQAEEPPWAPAPLPLAKAPEPKRFGPADPGEKRFIHGFALSPSGELIATIDGRGRVLVRRMEDLGETKRFEIGYMVQPRVAWQGEDLLHVVGIENLQGKRVRLSTDETVEMKWRTYPLFFTDRAGRSAVGWQVRTDLFALTDDGAKEIWKQTDTSSCDLALAPAGDRFAIVREGLRKWIEVRDTRSGEVVKLVRAPMCSVALSADGARLAIPARSEVAVMDIDSGKVLARFRQPTDLVEAVGGYYRQALDEHGERLASLFGREILIYDLTSGQDRPTLRLPVPRYVHAIRWRGDQLFVQAHETELLMWELPR